ncbi:hypothetical protein F2Q68_00017158 [Brassica cretica]|uniref:MATH domain-containing protein n=1 Tax=Brassica cretica TaxID=69181 RepID=A0A8S9H934_BRACR|nr:hypothetical protein F2Q68_00017158 [Brassica cretica]
MDGTFLMLHSKLFDQGSLIVFGWRRRRKRPSEEYSQCGSSRRIRKRTRLAISQLFTGNFSGWACFNIKFSEHKWGETVGKGSDNYQQKVEYRLANGHVEPSPEFFYAGSMWKISIQAFDDEDTQGHRTIGLFLHHREAEITDSIRTKHDPFQRGSQSSKEGSIQRILTMKKMSKRGFSLSGWNENLRRDRASCNAISLSSNGRLGGIR